MAQISDIAQRVMDYFQNVPNEIELKQSMVEQLVEEAAVVHGYDASATNIDNDDKLLVTLYAQASTADFLAANTAGFYIYSDAEENINKTNVGDQYRHLASILWDRYEGYKTSVGGAGVEFNIMNRADR